MTLIDFFLFEYNGYRKGGEGEDRREREEREGEKEEERESFCRFQVGVPHKGSSMEQDPYILNNL